MNLGLFVISAAILALEILHMRILSVQMWYHHAYVIVTMAMLGFAVSGTVATLWRMKDDAQAARVAGWCATLFAWTSVGGHIALTQIAAAETTLLSFTILLVPYFFGGMVVTLALSYGKKIHTLYFWNLLGSALGAWVFIWLIAPMGAERLLVLLAAAGPLTTFGFLRGVASGRGARIAAAVTLVVIAVLGVWNPDSLHVRTSPEKAQFRTDEPYQVDERWTSLARIDLYASEPYDWRNPAEGAPVPEKMMIVQDGAAGTIMHAEGKFQGWELLDSHMVCYLPHLSAEGAVKDDLSVAIIGIGGGSDIRMAKQLQAKRVLALEINEEMARITGEDYAKYNGGIFDFEGVEVAIGEGRSTLQRRGEKFDVISLAGADTYTAGAYGAFVLSESYLYTNEAIDVFLDHLKPGGTCGILRFYDEPHREGLRLFGMALLRLRDRGVAKPSLHGAVTRGFWSSGTVFSNEPLSEFAISLLRTADDQPYNVDLNEVLYLPGDTDTPFADLAAAIDGGTEEEFYAAYEAEHGLNVRPVSDDSPFFFNFHHLWEEKSYEDSAFSRNFNTSSPIAPSILRTLFLQIGGLVLVLVLLPLVFLRRETLRRPHAGRQLVFFLGVGAAFMLLEISTAQRLVLFLGHPTYSLTVVLFSFLLFAGLGAFVSGMFKSNLSRVLRIVGVILCIAVVVFTIVMRTALPSLLHLELTQRIGVAIAMLAPLNFIMGMPFPLALRRLQQTEPKLLPWAIGANGGAGVMGSVFAVALAMETGFTVVGVLSFVLYGVAIWAVTSGPLGGGGASEAMSNADITESAASQG